MLLIEAFAPADTQPSVGCDRLVLPFEARTRSRLRTRLSTGEEVGLFLPRGTLLQDGDLLQAADGRLVRVQAQAELLVEVRSADPVRLARAAYHLGNRHVAVQIGDGFLRFARDSVLEGMVEQLGLALVPVEAPFAPEVGAYGSAHTHGAEQLPGTPRIHDHFAS
jgi:urease accessory protein